MASINFCYRIGGGQTTFFFTRLFVAAVQVAH
jgi:hypothetical protein